jgi:hypothetical protein
MAVEALFQGRIEGPLLPRTGGVNEGWMGVDGPVCD